MQWYFPLFTASFVLAVGIQLAFDLPYYYLIFVPMIWLVSRNFQKGWIAICVAFGIGAGILYAGCYADFIHKPLEGLDGKGATLSATVISYADRYEDTQRAALRVHCKESGLGFWLPSFTTMAYLPLTEQTLVPGDSVKGYFTFYRGSSNGGFDRAEYYAERNFHILASCDYDLAVDKREAPLHLRPLVWSQGLKDRLDEHLDVRTASFLKALLLGDKKGLSVYDRQDFQKAGISHIMAVSGMHVGFLVAFFILIFGRRFGLILSLTALAVFVPMAGATPSVIRAAIMYAFAAFGFFLRLENSAVHSLCAALVFLLLLNPYALGSAGLQLSFLATLGLVLLGKKIQQGLLSPFQAYLKSRRSKRLAYAVTGAVSCSLSATVFTMPVLFASFGYISAAALPANLLTISVFSLVFILGFFVCLFGSVPALGGLLAVLCHGFSAYVFYIAGLLGKWTSLLLYWDSWFVKAAVILIYGIILVKLLAKKRFPAQYAAVLICGIAAITIYANAQAMRNRYEVTVFSCGSGQAIGIAAGREQFAVIDCSGSGYVNAADKIQEYMDWYNFADIDLLVLTALDKAHARNVPELLSTIPVGQIVLPAGTQQSEIGDAVLSAAAQGGIPATTWQATEERPVGTDMLGLSLLGGTPRKLGVHIKKHGINLLDLHSFTPKMTEAFLQTIQVSCTQLILSDGTAGNDDLLSVVIEAIQPKEIILSSSWSSSDFSGAIPIRSTKTEGDIQYVAMMERGRMAWQ